MSYCDEFWPLFFSNKLLRTLLTNFKIFYTSKTKGNWLKDERLCYSLIVVV